MIRLTIADLPGSKDRTGCAKETTNRVASQGKLVVYCSFRLGAPGRKVGAIWTLVVGEPAPGRPQKLASNIPPDETSHRTVPPLSGPTPGSLRLKRQTMTLPRSPFKVPVTGASRPESTYLPLKVSPAGRVVHSLPLPPNRLDS